MFSSLALDERTMKFCEKTSETLRNALDIFFERRIARWLVGGNPSVVNFSGSRKDALAG